MIEGQVIPSFEESSKDSKVKWSIFALLTISTFLLVSHIQRFGSLDKPRTLVETSAKVRPLGENVAGVNTEYEGIWKCSKEVYDCSSFGSREEAQKVFEYCGGPTNDPHKLDSDNDGVVCKNLL